MKRKNKKAAIKATAAKKPAKKGTLYRKFRAWVMKIEHRQMHDSPPIAVRDDDPHTCLHCGVQYKGDYCPSCGMRARWRRFNWRLLLLNFMDIWGLGNRPMFRTVRDLFWRPGYMIREYLQGHHLSYFPPFKMLAVWTVLLIFTLWIMKKAFGIVPTDDGSVLQGMINSIGGVFESPTTNFLIEKFKALSDYLHNNMLYNLILQNVLVVLAVKWAFRKISTFNLVETFISQVYINCQFHILAVATMLLTWSSPSFVSVFPYMKGFIPPLLLLTYDFHQLYAVKWKRALWKVIVTSCYLFLLYLLTAILLACILLATEFITHPETFDPFFK